MSQPEVKCAHDKLVPLGELKGNPRNPNHHPKKQVELLAKVILKQGWRAPITVSNRSGLICRGHGRLEAAKLLGCESAPVDFQDYASEAEELADMIADNRLSELADMAQEELVELLGAIRQEDLDFDLTGFSTADLDKMIERASRDEERPEVEFTEELLTEHNYVVLYFSDPLTWQVAVEKFGLKKVRDLVPRKKQPLGIGRVLRGEEWLDRIS
jgi:ParB-like chromosome segregation protein Spo0J